MSLILFFCRNNVGQKPLHQLYYSASKFWRRCSRFANPLELLKAFLLHVYSIALWYHNSKTYQRRFMNWFHQWYSLVISPVLVIAGCGSKLGWQRFQAHAIGANEWSGIVLSRTQGDVGRDASITWEPLYRKGTFEEAKSIPVGALLDSPKRVVVCPPYQQSIVNSDPIPEPFAIFLEVVFDRPDSLTANTSCDRAWPRVCFWVTLIFRMYVETLSLNF